MPRKQKEPTPSIEQIIEPMEELTVEKPKRTRKAKVAEPAPEVSTEPAPVKQKRAPSKWVTALKQYNEGRSGYIIPKKGTSEYEAVRALMG